MRVIGGVRGGNWVCRAGNCERRQNGQFQSRRVHQLGNENNIQWCDLLAFAAAAVAAVEVDVVAAAVMPVIVFAIAVDALVGFLMVVALVFPAEPFAAAVIAQMAMQNMDDSIVCIRVQGVEATM